MFDSFLIIDISFLFIRLFVDCLEGSSTKTSGFKVDPDECHS